MKTAVEWIKEKYLNSDFRFSDFEKALEMEKEQIEKSHIDGGKNKRTAVKYYNETFKTDQDGKE